jgi:predicted HicB family RNase H-like nuclease
MEVKFLKIMNTTSLYKEMLEYDGYTSIMSYLPENRVYTGKLTHIQNLVTFEGKTPEEAREAFKEAVIDYQETLKMF